MTCPFTLTAFFTGNFKLIVALQQQINGSVCHVIFLSIKINDGGVLMKKDSCGLCVRLRRRHADELALRIPSPRAEE